MDRIEVVVTSWEKHQPRKDLKHPAWFRLDHSFIDSPDFYAFNAEEKLVWIMLLSLASRKSSAKVSFLIEYAIRGCSISRERLLSALQKLSDGGQITYSIRTDPAQNLALTRQDIQDKTRQTEHTGQLSEKVEKTKRAKAPPETLRVRATLKAYWLERFQKLFGHPYAGADSAFFNATLKKIHETLGEKTFQAIEDYLAWNDPFIAKKGHPLHMLLPNLHSLEAQKHRPGQTMGMVARGRAQERVLTETEQRLEEMKAYARRDNPGLLPDSAPAKPRALDPGGGESLGRVISLSAEAGVPEKRSGLHGGNPSTDTEAG